MMYAVVRDNPYDPTKLAQGQKQLDEFQAIHARQPGACGTLLLDAGNGHVLTVNLWESEEQASAALPVLVPEVRRLLEPMMTAPSQLIGAGNVVYTDLIRR